MLTDMEATQLTKREQFRYQDAHLEIDLAKQFAVIDSRRLTLTRKEYLLLVALVANAGEVVPREALLMRVWGYGDGIRTRTLDTHIHSLRMRLGLYGEQYIETAYGMGYRFQPLRAAPGTGQLNVDRFASRQQSPARQQPGHRAS